MRCALGGGATLPRAVSLQNRVVRVLDRGMPGPADKLRAQQDVSRDAGRNVLPSCGFGVVEGGCLRGCLDEERRRLVGPWRDPSVGFDDFVIEEELLPACRCS